MADNLVREAVSKKKRRYKEDGFNLDLSYITSRIIAMGWPSTGGEAMYRNPLVDVKRFFKKKHGDKFKVYNLCEERAYPDSHFSPPGKVCQAYRFLDHNAPPFEIIEQFCLDLDEWLSKDKENVAAIHCKAGKGRTGTVIAAYLIHINLHNMHRARCSEVSKDPQLANAGGEEYTLFANHNDPELFTLKDAPKALEFYAEKRTYNKKGVTIPSQIRYVNYYEQYLLEGTTYYDQTKILKFIKMFGVPHTSSEGCAPYFIIETMKDKELIFNSKDKGTPKLLQKEPMTIFEVNIPLTADNRITFLDNHKRNKDAKLFTVWFNTFFVKDNIVRFGKFELDKACKDKNHKIYDEDFAIELIFEDCLDMSPKVQYNKLLRYGSSSSVSSFLGASHDDDDDRRDMLERIRELTQEVKQKNAVIDSLTDCNAASREFEAEMRPIPSSNEENDNDNDNDDSIETSDIAVLREQLRKAREAARQRQAVIDIQRRELEEAKSTLKRMTDAYEKALCGSPTATAERVKALERENEQLKQSFNAELDKKVNISTLDESVILDEIKRKIVTYEGTPKSFKNRALSQALKEEHKRLFSQYHTKLKIERSEFHMALNKLIDAVDALTFNGDASKMKQLRRTPSGQMASLSSSSSSSSSAFSSSSAPPLKLPSDVSKRISQNLTERIRALESSAFANDGRRTEKDDPILQELSQRKVTQSLKQGYERISPRGADLGRTEK